MSPLLPPRPSARFDERDTVLARMARRPGTAPYEEYYLRRADLKEIDDRMRRMPALHRPGGRHYHPEISLEAERLFEAIPEIRPDRDAVEKWKSRLAEAGRKTPVVKEMVLELGAVAVGCTALDQAFVYSHKGRHDADYGREIRLDHSSAVVFLVEMDFAAMRRTPKAETLRESARRYYRAAVISRTAAAVLHACGFEAASHHDAHYDVILPPLAIMAGLGELGRNNILIAHRYGSRVRIGAVTTNMPLEHDAPAALGADHFCLVCKKCARNCPARALSPGDKQEVRGVRKWPTDAERCYRYWRAAGTDCGICMACCPFSHHNTAFHNFIRGIVRRYPFSHRAFRFLDDLFYGRKWKPS